MKWRARVDAVALHTITPAKIVAWKNKRLRDAEADPLAKRRAIVTVNSLIRNSKSLFGRKLLPFIEQSINLPHPQPFDGVALEKEPSLRSSRFIPALSLTQISKAMKRTSCCEGWIPMNTQERTKKHQSRKEDGLTGGSRGSRE